MFEFLKKIWKYSGIAIVAVAENKARSLLTMLGIIIGVGAVVLMTSLGKGAESYILGTVSSFGSDLLYIQPGSPADGLTGAITSPDRVKYRDYLNLRRSADFLDNITPFLVYNAILVRGNSNENTPVVGTTRGYSKALDFYAANGRFVEDSDVSSSAKVVVLGYKIADKLFGNVNPVGQDLKVKGLTFKVIGVMEVQGGSAFENYDDMAFIPITTMQTYLFGADYVQTIMANAKIPMPEAILQTREVMRRLHNINNPNEDLAKDDFNILSQEQALGIFTSVSGVLTLFIVLIASISLIVGGIGIMNIMFVSVNQRTREIGLRKAVGATSGDILLQFLIEAIVLTLIGGLIGAGGGIGVSFLLSLIIKQFQASWQFIINIQALFVSVGVSALVGIVFGLYPARRAAKLDPIEALRYE